MKYSENEPVVNGRAAIIYSEIRLTSIKKGQYDDLIKYLVEHDHVFEYTTAPTDYSVTVMVGLMNNIIFTLRISAGQLMQERCLKS